MPRRAAKPCAQPGCPALVRGETRCEKHARERATRYARQDRRQRGSARERGYDTLWEKVRAQHLASEPLCRACSTEGRTTPAQDVDHIVPFDGLHDPLRLDPENLQSLCRPCHNAKTARQGRHA